MAQKLLDEKELQEAINYQIISPSFAERVRELIKAYEQNAAQQSVQLTMLTGLAKSVITKILVLLKVAGFVNRPATNANR